MKVKKIIFIIIAIAIVIGIGVAIGIGGNKNKSNAKYKVVASNFASYDFLRAIIGDNQDIELTFLLGPGNDASSNYQDFYYLEVLSLEVMNEKGQTTVNN